LKDIKRRCGHAEKKKEKRGEQDREEKKGEKKDNAKKVSNLPRK
jgi:hypothetical protein